MKIILFAYTYINNNILRLYGLYFKFLSLSLSFHNLRDDDDNNNNKIYPLT